MDSSKIKQSKEKLQEVLDEEVKRKIEYFSHQLDLAHKRNDLVDHLRFNILQIFFGFQTFLIGSMVLKGGDISTVSNQLGEYRILLPLFAFLTGLSLYVMFFRYHIYLYGYKKWIENLENCLTEMVFSLEGDKNLNGYTGTYSLARDIVFNTSKIKLEVIVLFSLLLMTILNIGVAFFLLRLFEIPLDISRWLSLLGFIFQIIIALLLFVHNSKI